MRTHILLLTTCGFHDRKLQRENKYFMSRSCFSEVVGNSPCVAWKLREWINNSWSAVAAATGVHCVDCCVFWHSESQIDRWFPRQIRWFFLKKKNLRDWVTVVSWNCPFYIRSRSATVSVMIISLYLRASLITLSSLVCTVLFPGRRSEEAQKLLPL